MAMLMSVGRQPSCQVSVVSMRTSKPDFQARFKRDSVYQEAVSDTTVRMQGSFALTISSSWPM